MICAIRDHQRKSYGIRDALRSEGWWVLPGGAPADVLLIDWDGDRPGYRDMIQAYEQAGSRVCIYPHGANVMCIWDGLSDPYPVDACLVAAEGHAEVLRRYGYPYPIEVIGWSICEQRPFQHVRGRSRVLFCAQHPLGNGFLREDLVVANQKAFAAVLGWGMDVTVRHVASLEANGIERIDGVEYEQARLETTIGSIDTHDLVVGRDTILTLAVARGKPAITFHQVPVTNDPEGPGEPEIVAAHWDEYADLIRYPFDLEDPDALFKASTGEASEWRRLFIGEQLDPARLSSLLQRICDGRGSPPSPPGNGGRPVGVQAPA